jgi:hypothetical protein
VVLRKAVQIIVMTVTVVTLPIFIELLRDAACTLSRDRHVIVMVSVTEETPYLSGFLAGVTVMTLMTALYGLILDRGAALLRRLPYPLNAWCELSGRTLSRRCPRTIQSDCLYRSPKGKDPTHGRCGHLPHYTLRYRG